MNYIHCHIGQIPPEYLLDSIRSINSVEPKANIILVTDKDVKVDGVSVIKVDDIASKETKKVLNMSLFANDPNPLWRTSIFRVFLVRDALQSLELDFCYHFDSDVLLFQPSSLFEKCTSDFDGLYITPCNNDELVFGFSRFGNSDKINELCDLFSDIVFDEHKQNQYSVGMPNEMQLLGGIYKKHSNLIRLLPTIPNKTSEFVFDPSSYGQYFGGTHQGHGPGWYGNHHNIGRNIGEGVIKPIMINRKPYVEYEGNSYPIVNLHIHSKNTSQFLI